MLGPWAVASRGLPRDKAVDPTSRGSGIRGSADVTATDPAERTFSITTAISYPNGAPHIGHAYEVIATDAIARCERLDGYDVQFTTGTDEHGLKIQQTAARAGVTPRAFVDDMAARFQGMADALNCSYDRFIRTTAPAHAAAAAAV